MVPILSIPQASRPHNVCEGPSEYKVTHRKVPMEAGGEGGLAHAVQDFRITTGEGGTGGLGSSSDCEQETGINQVALERSGQAVCVP